MNTASPSDSSVIVGAEAATAQQSLWEPLGDQRDTAPWGTQPLKAGKPLHPGLRAEGGFSGRAHAGDLGFKPQS